MKEEEEGDEDFPVIDGFKIRVVYCWPGIKAIVEAANPAGDPCGQDAVSREGCDAYGNNVWHSLNSTGMYMVSSGMSGGQLRHLERGISYAASSDFEMRFTEAGGFAVYGFMDDIICRVPFEIWKTGIGTPDDPSDDLRMIPFISWYDSSKAIWGWANGMDEFLGMPCSGRVYFMDPEDVDAYMDFASFCEQSGGAGSVYDWRSDGSSEGYFVDFHGAFNHLIGTLVLVDWAGTGFSPPAGTVIRFLTNKTVRTNTVFSFNTADYRIFRSSEIAKSRLGTINVFPNPYHALAPGGLEWSNPYVTFLNLPGSCVIRIFSLSGRLVRTLKHEDGTPFERWDLANENGKTVGGGMYIALVQTQYGEKTLKLAVVDR